MRAEQSTGAADSNRSLYQHTADLFDLRYAQKDYGVDANRFLRLADRVHPDAKNLLDVACGSGQHLLHLQHRYKVEGLDLSAELLQTARNRLPGVPLHHADMTTFELGRTFDIVSCFFASTPYLVTTDRLGLGIDAMARHLAPGGFLFIEPWLTPDVYRENEVVHNLRQTPDVTASWMYVMRRQANVAVWDIHWLIGTRGEGVEHFVEREELALFTTSDYEVAFKAAGLHAVHDQRGLHGYGGWIARSTPWSPADVKGIHETLSDDA